MLNREDLVITFPNEHEKVLFMKWLDTSGLFAFQMESFEYTEVNKISFIDYGETPDDLQYKEVPNGVIEIE